jgi:hypothetical protein
MHRVCDIRRMATWTRRIEAVQATAAQVVKWLVAGWIGASRNHRPPPLLDLSHPISDFATFGFRSQWFGCTTGRHDGHSLRLQDQLRLNQFSLDRIHDGFQPIVRSELLVNVVQVVAESLQADVERLGDLGRVFPVGEQPEDVPLLRR